jgi:hypothetical protein
MFDESYNVKARAACACASLPRRRTSAVAFR